MNMKSLGMYGAQGSGTTVQQFLGVGSRAALAAFTVAGQTPYAFAATQPFTAGDDIWVRNPAAVAAGATSINFSSVLTTSGASYTDPQGCHYVPVSNNGVADPLGRANFRAYRGMTLSGGGLAVGTTVVATHDNGLIVSAQPAGTSVPNGTALTLGADLSGVRVGMQMWAAHGLTPLCTVSAINGQTVSMSGPVVSFQTPAGSVRPGVDLLAQVCFYTPLAEATLTQNITMDTLAFLAAYYNAGYGDTVFVDPLVYCFRPHVIAAGCSVTFAGLHGNVAAFSATTNSTTIKIFPQPGATVGFYNILWRAYNGCQPAYLEIDGSGFQDVQPNICPVTVRLENNGGYVGGYNSANPAASVGAYAQFKLRNIGNLRANDNSFQGFGRTVYGADQFDLASIVLGYMSNNGAAYVWSQCEQNGYCEDLIMRDWCQDSSGAAFDGINSGIFNGYSNLIWKFSGGDNDVSRVITRIVGGLEISLHDTEASFNGCENRAGAGYVFNGCVRGSVLGIQGGTGGGGNGQPVDLIQLGCATLNGNYQGTTQFRVAEVSVGGFANAVHIMAGANNNSIDMDSIINWGATAVLDLGSNQHTGGLTVSTGTFAALSAAENAAINAAVGSAVQSSVATLGATLSPPVLSAINSAVSTSVGSSVAALAGTVSPPMLTAINSAVSTSVGSTVAALAGTVTPLMLTAINSAVSTSVGSSVAALAGTVPSPLLSAINSAVSTSVGSSVAALTGTVSAPMLSAINSAVSTTVAASVATLSSSVSPPLLSAINTAVSTAVAALPAASASSALTTTTPALTPAITAAIGSAVATAVAAQPTTLSPSVSTAIGSAVNAAIAAASPLITPLVNAAVVHNPTYFSGGFTSVLTIPGGGNGLLVKLSTFGDAGNNFNGTNYVIPSTGIYRVAAVVKLANTGGAGVCPAGTSVGLQFCPGTTVNFDMMQFDVTNALRNTIRFELDVYYTAGTLISCIIYSDVGTQARSGTMTIMRVA